MLDGCKVGSKSSWWQWFRLEIVDDMISDPQVPSKLFWNTICLQQYKQDNPFLTGSRSPAKCGNINCPNTFLQIKKGAFIGDVWYCSDDCLPVDLPEGEDIYRIGDEDEGDDENQIGEDEEDQIEDDEQPQEQENNEDNEESNENAE